MQKKPSNKNLNRVSRLKVEEADELLNFLLKNIKDKTRNKVKGMLARKQFMINDKIIKQFDHTLKVGDMVKVSWDKPFNV